MILHICLWACPFPPEQSLGGFSCSVPQSLKTRDAAGAQSMPDPGMPNCIPNLPMPSKFQNSPLPSTALSSHLSSFPSPSNPDQSLPGAPASLDPKAPLASHWGLCPFPPSTLRMHLWHPSQDPFTFLGWPILPLLDATCAVCLASCSLGTRKTKFII